MLISDRADLAQAGKPVKRLRILVIEDDPFIGLLLAEVLTGMGHEVCAVELTEADAVAAAIRCTPDLMIVDEHLGEGSGLAAVAEITLGGSIPHVFVSGDAARISRLKPDAIVMEKPYHERDLARAIRRAMGLSASPAKLDSA
jgi:CheY-like chemotaxis protein